MKNTCTKLSADRTPQWRHLSLFHANDGDTVITYLSCLHLYVEVVIMESISLNLTQTGDNIMLYPIQATVC